ncbi:MAG TPA: hypothetical protein VNE58_04490 [Casimicrobiaceae bacterium]|nr:hypothetical protein [Casimicrobiaceae bacterium]
MRDFVKWNDTAASAALRVALRSRHRAGADAEDLLWLQLPALVVPGNDESHATTAARYLFECLPLAQYWDAAVESQTESTMPETLLTFLAANEIKGSTR